MILSSAQLNLNLKLRISIRSASFEGVLLCFDWWGEDATAAATAEFCKLTFASFKLTQISKLPRRKSNRFEPKASEKLLLQLPSADGLQQLLKTNEQYNNLSKLGQSTRDCLQPQGFQ
jgi:hypothetical protein